jgi:hypothetical protein
VVEIDGLRVLVAASTSLLNKFDLAEMSRRIFTGKFVTVCDAVARYALKLLIPTIEVFLFTWLVGDFIHHSSDSRRDQLADIMRPFIEIF